MDGSGSAIGRAGRGDRHVPDWQHRRGVPSPREPAAARSVALERRVGPIRIGPAAARIPLQSPLAPVLGRPSGVASSPPIPARPDDRHGRPDGHSARILYPDPDDGPPCRPSSHGRPGRPTPAEPAVLEQLARGRSVRGASEAAGPHGRSMPGGPVRSRSGLPRQPGADPHRPRRPGDAHGGRGRRPARGTSGPPAPSAGRSGTADRPGATPAGQPPGERPRPQRCPPRGRLRGPRPSPGTRADARDPSSRGPASLRRPMARGVNPYSSTR